MTKQNCIEAINRTAKDLGLKHWTEICDESFVPLAMHTLSAVMWVNQHPENEDTKLIREQQKNIYEKGRLIFDEVKAGEAMFGLLEKDLDKVEVKTRKAMVELLAKDLNLDLTEYLKKQEANFKKVDADRKARMRAKNNP